ncbi:MAG: helix-turn-helix transcriptional regulator [Flavobacteriales bacterium]|nr:helix-turn-helix transcriptional regulator [Flavobacteriales bacterium]
MGIDIIFKWILIAIASATILISFVLIFNKHKLFSLRLLGVLALTRGYSAIIYDIESISFYSKFPHFYGVAVDLAFLFFPLVYLFIQTYLNIRKRQFSNILIHLLPAFFFMMALSAFYFQSGDNKSEIITNLIPDWAKEILFYSEAIFIIVSLFYAVITYKLLVNFTNNKKLSNNEKGGIEVITQFLIAISVIWIIWIIGLFLKASNIIIPFDLMILFHSAITSILLIFGAYIYRNPLMFKKSKENKNTKDYAKDIIEVDDSEQKQKSIIDNSQNKEIIQKILTLLEDETIYTDSGLTLESLSYEVGINKNKVSEAINSELKISFNDMINDFRIKKVLKLIEDGTHENLKLLDLAELSGFNSKSTFNRAFKNTTGKTPTQYIKDLSS